MIVSERWIGEFAPEQQHPARAPWNAMVSYLEMFPGNPDVQKELSDSLLWLAAAYLSTRGTGYPKLEDWTLDRFRPEATYLRRYYDRLCEEYEVAYATTNATVSFWSIKMLADLENRLYALATWDENEDY